MFFFTQPLLAEQSAEEEEEVENFNDMVRDSSELQISSKVISKLYQHQFVGVQWLHKLYRKKMKGGILADDMGYLKNYYI